MPIFQTADGTLLKLESQLDKKEVRTMQTAIDILKRERLSLLVNIESFSGTEYEKLKRQCKTVLDLNEAIDTLECEKLNQLIEK